MKNETNKTLVVYFIESFAGAYFLEPGESLPKKWADNYTIASINDA